MKQRKRGLLSVRGVPILGVLALMSLSAASAQAELTFETRDNDGTLLAFSSSLLVAPIGGASKLLTDVGVTVECTSTEGHGNVTSKTHGEATLIFLGCKVTGGSDVCKISKSEIKSLVEFDLKSAEGTTWHRFFPETNSGGHFTTVTFEDVGSEECTLIKAGAHAETLTVVGDEAGLVDINAGVDKLLFSKTFSELAKANSVITGLKVGSHKAWIDGEAEVEVLNGSKVKIGTLEAHS